MLRDFVQRLESDFPEVNFRVGKKFSFRAPKTVYYEQFWDEKGAEVEQFVAKTTQQAQNVDFEQDNCTINERTANLCYKWLILHEIGHARLKHCDYGADLKRLKMERAAWEEAQKLARRYNLEIDEDFIEEKLDTYREWLHNKSKCPQCGMTRCQGADGEYFCPVCDIISRKG